MRHLIGLIPAILLSSCAMTNANNYTQTVQNWRGGKLHDLVRIWGTPNLKMPGTNGHTIYVYKTVGYSNTNLPTSPAIGINTGREGKPVFVTPSNTNNTWTNGPMPMNCYTAFTVDKHNVIVNTRVQGQGCYNAKANPGML